MFELPTIGVHCENREGRFEAQIRYNAGLFLAAPVVLWASAVAYDTFEEAFRSGLTRLIERLVPLFEDVPA